MMKLKKQPKKGICVALWCTNKTQHKFCSRCRHRDFKERNPIAYTFNALRSNAKRRNKPFNLSLEEFTKFCIEHDYIRLKGIYKNCLTIDRKRHNEGYQYDNLQVLTNSDNMKKRWVDYYASNGIITLNSSNSPIKEPEIDTTDIVKKYIIDDLDVAPF